MGKIAEQIGPYSIGEEKLWILTSLDKIVPRLLLQLQQMACPNKSQELGDFLGE